MSEINWQNVLNNAQSNCLEAMEKVAVWGGHTVTFLNSGAIKPGVIGLLSLALSICMVAAALFLAFKALALSIAGLTLIASGAGTAPGLALLGWSILSASGALTVGLLALIPFATALGAFTSAQDHVHRAFHPASHDAAPVAPT